MNNIPISIKNYCNLLLFFLVCNFCFAQKVIGTVEKNNGQSVKASILFRDIQDAKKVKEFVLAPSGKFEYDLKKEYKTIIINIKSEGYESEEIIIENPLKSKIYLYNVVLKESKKQVLNEVVVIANKRFEIKKDTVSFNVNAYKDGSERKIEEIIKKLPGIEVNEHSGEIKYKGKSIETVTLDGDNLFGFNYSLGTKNINVDMVKQIEAIENYSDNPLLKGIEQGDKVALNIKLEKGRFDFSGNIEIGSGYIQNEEQALDINTNILGITKTYKSFATVSYNNIGINQTPFDYFGFDSNVEQLKEKDFFTKKVIPETQFSNFLDDKRANINNQFFGNYNSIFKIGEKLSIKTNLYYLKDKIVTNQVLTNRFEINDTNFTTIDDALIAKTPIQYRGDVELKYNISKSSLLEYNVKIRQENIETSTELTQNKTDDFNSFLESKDFYMKHNLLWTKKLSDKKALQISIVNSFNKLPQKLLISPSISDNNSNNFQKSIFQKKYLQIESTLFGAKRNDKYSFTIGGNLDENPFASHFFNRDDEVLTSVISKENDFDYFKRKIFFNGNYNFNLQKWKITPAFFSSLLNQHLNNNIDKQIYTTDNFTFEPSLKVSYKINPISFLTTHISFNKIDNEEQFFFTNEVLISSRTTIRNLPSLELQKSQRYHLSYFINDLYRQFQLSADINYQKLSGNYSSNFFITENTTQIEYFYTPNINNNWNSKIMASKYLPFIKSTLRFGINYSVSHYKNIVNNSDLEQNKREYVNNKFFWKTAFSMPINFENDFNWRYSKSKKKNHNGIINNSFQNTSKIISKVSKKWFVILSSDYYLPSINNIHETYFFLDFTVRYRPKNKKWNTNLSVRNLTNESNFEQVTTSDISTSIFRSNLLPRYILINLNWSF